MNSYAKIIEASRLWLLLYICYSYQPPLIYLLLDTNIWLYLANGLDTATSSYQEKQHFELLAKLKKLVADREVCVLINDIIIEEWKRNKASAYAQIKVLKSKEEATRNIFKSRLRRTDNSLLSTRHLMDEIRQLREHINKNENHIPEVEDFLINKCEKVPITDAIKLKVFDLGIKKLPPFHNKKNNTADAAILFSAAEYLREKLQHSDVSAFFVSNNFKEFTNNLDKAKFHPELTKVLSLNDLQYQNYLPTALNLSGEIINELKEFYRQQDYYDSITFACQSKDCSGQENFTPIGYLNQTAGVIFTSDALHANQINLFTNQAKKKPDRGTTGYGPCIFCGTIHFTCPNCKEIICLDDSEDHFACEECESKYKLIKFDAKTGQTIVEYLDADPSNRPDNTW